MTKRKSKRVVLKTKRFRPKLDTVFSCPFCSHEKSVDCKMYALFPSLTMRERPKAMASLNCRVCQAGYQTTINSTILQVVHPLQVSPNPSTCMASGSMPLLPRRQTIKTSDFGSSPPLSTSPPNPSFVADPLTKHNAMQDDCICSNNSLAVQFPIGQRSVIPNSFWTAARGQ